VTVDRHGDLYVADSFNHRIQKLSPTGIPLAEWGGRGGAPGQFRRPEGLAVDEGGSIVVVDADNDRLQRYVPSVAPR
jgi:tripartite motif-containing protein 71